MRNTFRLPDTGRIDRGKPVSFRFNGTQHTGFVGDTLASALLANGVHLVGRSFKYHRPRGFLSAGAEEPNALVTVTRGAGRTTPNLPATMIELYEGLEAHSQNHWPSLSFDVGAVNDLLHPLFAAGFYYKTFMWPRSFWDKVYEPFIRQAAGLGKSPTQRDPDIYTSRHAFCDVLIVGAGAAGIAAALAAAKTGAQVILADEQAKPGGTMLKEHPARIDGAPSDTWLHTSLATLREAENVTVLERTCAFGVYHENFIGLRQALTDHQADLPPDQPRERLWKVRAKAVVLAQGAIERPMSFSGNDRPGVMLAGAARTYLNGHGVCVGHRPVIVTSNDTAWQSAFDLAGAGMSVSAIVDVRDTVAKGLVARADRAGIAVFTGSQVLGTSGRLRVSSITISSPKHAGQKKIACDSVLMSAGWTPSLHLWSQASGAIAWDDALQAYVPDGGLDGVFVAGAGSGKFGLAEALVSGWRAGAHAVASAGFELTAQAPAFKVRGEAISSPATPALTHPQGRAFVDFQNDVTTKDIRLAVQEGFRSVEHIKRYTTTGMATDQGKTSNINALATSASALGVAPHEAGLTKFRPPYTPITFGTLAALRRDETFQPVRKTPIDPWAEDKGAVFEPVSLWRRARYFPKAHETMHQAVARECRSVREGVGMFDASTLGKIEVVGPDAAEFLNRLYVNAWTTLKPGRCKYGVLLGEDGFIRDDGVIARIAEDRFHVTTTTGGAARVLTMMEDYRQTEWPDLKVWLTSTTEQWAVIAVNGPNAKRLIEPFIEGIDLSDETFRHMSYAEGTIAGVELRLFRVSFTGERGYEINVPASEGLRIWDMLHAAGADHGLVVYGTETMHVLRAEKGYIIVGQDTDGTVTPQDAGLAWAIGKKKPDFVGKRSLTRPDMLLPDRPQLVGLLTADAGKVLEEGAQVVSDWSATARPLGHVTSSYWSEALGRSIALALVAGGHDAMDTEVTVVAGRDMASATITGTVFYDPKGERINA
ncbi:MAG: sarcosine oxidase subunit alpha family protein [Hyphomonadaceae bacterium]|nr:sarcosine oxidase subunit alpha family protein [Hyphomonadaceae bacterium]